MNILSENEISQINGAQNSNKPKELTCLVIVNGKIIKNNEACPTSYIQHLYKFCIEKNANIAEYACKQKDRIDPKELVRVNCKNYR